MALIQLFDFIIDTKLPSVNAEKKSIVNTINPHSYCVSKNDVLFKESLVQSDVLLPDGTGIVFGVRFLNNKKINRITGSDLHVHILKVAQEKGLRVFYLGSTEDTLRAILQKNRIEYPSVMVDFFSPPFKDEFSDADNQLMIKKINDFSPHILFVGMTAPKQEKWVYQNFSSINTYLICSIGAVFDFYAGKIKRPGEKWQRLGLEWFPRLLKEPKRLFYRNFVSTPAFLIDVFKEKFKMVFLCKHRN